MRGFRPPIGLLFAGAMLLLVVGWPWLRVQAGWAARPEAAVTRAEGSGDSFTVAYEVHNAGRGGVVRIDVSFAPPDREATRRTTITRMGGGQTYRGTEVFLGLPPGEDGSRHRYTVTAEAVWRPLAW